MKKKYFQEKIVEGVIGSTTTSWVWFDKLNQILEGTTMANGTPNGLDQGYGHVESSQALTIEEDLLDDDTSINQVGSAPPQSPPSIILAFGTFANTSSMGIQSNTANESPHTRAANYLIFLTKLWETNDKN
jgi:ABC-type uncharacterized transport system YnjBCD substrate-binding protein